MVREQKKQGNGIEALAELEQVTYSEIQKINDIRKQEFKQEMNAGFFFSVVFYTNKERDQLLKERNLTLIENYFIRAEDFKY